MRISDWSSDVCSSDLLHSRQPVTPKRVPSVIITALVLGDQVRRRLQRRMRRNQPCPQGTLTFKCEQVVQDTPNNSFRRVTVSVSLGKGPVLAQQIGRASCRERVGPYGWNAVVS